MPRHLLGNNVDMPPMRAGVHPLAAILSADFFMREEQLITRKSAVSAALFSLAMNRPAAAGRRSFHCFLGRP